MDNIVLTGRQLLGEAIEALDKGDSYNSKHPYEAGFPNGFPDHCRMLMECVMRIDATGDRDKMVDYLGYAALYLGWMAAGCPKSEFSHIANRYMNLFKIQESRIALSELHEHEVSENTNGSGTLPQLSDQ